VLRDRPERDLHVAVVKMDRRLAAQQRPGLVRVAVLRKGVVADDVDRVERELRFAHGRRLLSPAPILASFCRPDGRLEVRGTESRAARARRRFPGRPGSRRRRER
jgi:hypothetical protein